MAQGSGFELGMLLYIGIFLGVLLLFEGLRQLASRRESRGEARSRRMKMIAQGVSTEEILKLLKPKAEDSGLRGLPFIGSLPVHLAQAGVRMAPGVFLTLCAVVAVSTGLMAGLALGPLVAPGTGISLGFVLPLTILRMVRKRRIDKLVGQLPDALELMARGLAVGHPLNTTIASVAEEMPDPIGSEFGIVLDQISFGEELPEAFRQFARRINVEDLLYLSAAISIQHGTGSDLAAVLNTLARVIRDRITMRKKIKAISAEGRLSSYFLSVLPILIFTMTSISAPNYYAGVREDPLFTPMMVIIVVLTVANFFAMQRLVRFRI